MKKKEKNFEKGSFVLIGFLIIFFYWRYHQPIMNVETEKDCPLVIEEKEVRGSSMEPLIKNGTTIRLLKDYQKCHDFKREDLIIYKYAGSKNPLIKKIKAIPDDKFSLKKNTQNQWNILINDQFLFNSQNQKYAFSEKKSKMLSLYARNYPVIPPKTYLILGEKQSGTTDSSQFGLIHLNDILGKAEIKK